MRPSKVAKELVGAIAEEQKRQAIDAAKKKAVAQHADYDTFKKMVSVAHLRPLQAPGKQSAGGDLLPAWQLRPDGGQVRPAASSTSAEQGPACSTAGPQTGPQQLPRNSQEFARDWRRHCSTPEAQYRLLQRCGPKGLGDIFRVEIDGLLLGQVLQAMQQVWAVAAAAPGEPQPPPQQQQQPCPPATDCSPSAAGAGATVLVQHSVQEAAAAVALLHSLTGAGRFDLNVRLLNAKAKQAAAQLCAALGLALQQPGAGSEASWQQEQPAAHGTAAACSSSSSSSSTGRGRNSNENANSGDDSMASITLPASTIPGPEGSAGAAQLSEAVAASLRLGAPGLEQSHRTAWGAADGQAGAAARIALEQLEHVRLKLRV